MRPDARPRLRAPRPPAHDRIALALAGGGPAGAVYEIGAVRALEEAVDGLQLTALGCYVGVSAGSFVAACLANGLAPTLLVRLLAGAVPGEEEFGAEHFFTPAYGEFARRGLRLPALVAEAVWQYARKAGDQTLRASLARLTGALPVAVFDNEPIRRYLARVLDRPRRTDDFRVLRARGRRLVVIAADLDSGRAVRFGEAGEDHVPISRAVQASTAIPGLYPPVMIDDRPCVDGVLLKTVHASVALEAGATLVLCVNPIVPADVRAGVSRGELPPDVLRRGGLATILSQTFRTLVHSRLEVGIATYGDRYPGTDVVLFEPARDDYGMFFGNIFSFAARRTVAELSYAATRRDLLARFEALAPTFARHGLRLRRDVLLDPTRDLWRGCGVAPPAGLVPRLDDALRRLERRRA